MSSSSELPRPGAPGRARVLRGAVGDTVRRPELRTGTWTRLGGAGVLGDAATEDALDRLAREARAAARAQGYAVGWAEGRRAAAARADVEAARAAEHDAAERERREHEHRSALRRLDAVTTALGEAVALVGAEVEDRALGIARELATAIVGRELRLSPDTGADAVRRALDLLEGATATRVRLCPADAACAEVDTLVGRGIAVVADPALEPGDVVVETDTAVLDARVAAALERVRAVLR